MVQIFFSSVRRMLAEIIPAVHDDWRTYTAERDDAHRAVRLARAQLTLALWMRVNLALRRECAESETRLDNLIAAFKRRARSVGTHDPN